MASACVNNAATYSWLSPRTSSFGRDFIGHEIAGENPSVRSSEEKEEAADLFDFEFRLDDPAVTMLAADELFADGKLVPLQLAAARLAAEVRSSVPPVLRSRRRGEVSGSDPCVISMSPRAPRCISTRWREILGLKRQQSPTTKPVEPPQIAAVSQNPKSLKHFRNRCPRSSSIDSPLSLPLPRDSDFSSRRSFSSSSSSSCPDHDDFHRLSLNSEKPSQARRQHNPPRLRTSQPAVVRRAAAAAADSPRMNASGRVVFQELERSSSSPGSGRRPRTASGMERSYSANIPVTRVLNVPAVRSLRGSGFGFGHLFSPPQKKDRVGGAARNHDGKIKIDRAGRASARD